MAEPSEVERQAENVWSLLNGWVLGFSGFCAIRDPHGDLVDFEVLFINRTGLKMAGRVDQEVVGQHFWSAFHDSNTAAQTFALLKNALDHKEMVQGRIEHCNEEVCIKLEASAWPGDGSDCVGLIWRDVTEDEHATAAMRDLIDKQAKVMGFQQAALETRQTLDEVSKIRQRFNLE